MLYWPVLIGAVKHQVVPVPVLELYKLIILMMGELSSHKDDQHKPHLLGRGEFC